MAEYALGLDFGSLSVRALIVDLNTGKECGTAVCPYSHGILDQALPDGTELPRDFVLQLPQDYWHGMSVCVREAMAVSGIPKHEIRGIGVCATASTVLPTLEDGTPLCELPSYERHPHAYMKMWKHHGAMDIAEQMKQLAAKRNEKWFEEYGRVITCEWLVPKALELAMRAPEIYQKAAYIFEVGDWLVYRLTGICSRSIAIARCNGMMREEERPSAEYFSEICPLAANLVEQKFSGIYQPIGSVAGYLTEEAAEFLGLEKGTPVGPAVVDCYATVLASGASRAGDLTMIVGTSAIEILLTDKPTHVEGIHISAQDSAVPGLYSLGGGQNCVGDAFEWFVRNCVPPNVWNAAEKEHKNLQMSLMEKAEKLPPGSSGLVALDWWNGLRSPSFRFDLSGSILGFTLHTRPEEIYRTMLEASVFGARRVIDRMLSAGCTVDRIFAGGGISQKNTLMMQIYADVLKRRIDVCESQQTGARGSVMLGALAAGWSLERVLKNLSSPVSRSYIPNQKAGEKYEKLYQIYLELAQWLEREESPIYKLRRV